LLEIVREIGAAAGVAAGVGLVVLSALHLSQARDMKRLREWADRAPERSGPGGTAGPASLSGPPRSLPWYGRVAARHVAVGLVGLLFLGGAAAYGLTRLAGDDARTAQADNEQRKRDGAPVKPGNVTVAVLNSTAVPGLAAALRDQIAAAGFKKGVIDFFSGQPLDESVVQYAPGHQAEAKAVGRSVGVSRREPVTADSRALAGDATVIVIAGADKAP
jgi:hypothetical protein